MSCCCTKRLIAEAIICLADVLRDQSEAWRHECFPPPSRPIGFGEPENLAERKDNDMWLEQLRQNFLPLPPPVGRDADIVKGLFVVTQGEAVVLQEDVLYNLQSRVPNGPSSVFEIEKGAEYTISLQYADDDGNVGEVATATLTAVDTVAPDAPEGFSTTENLGEREVPDAPPPAEPPAEEPPVVEQPPAEPTPEPSPADEQTPPPAA
jgi:hypothetical protein